MNIQRNYIIQQLSNLIFAIQGQRDKENQLELFQDSKLYKNKGTILRAILESRCPKTLQVCLELADGENHILDCLKKELDLDRTFIHAICETPLVRLVELAIKNETDQVLKRLDNDDVTPLMK